jgi:hypothetical protein
VNQQASPTIDIQSLGASDAKHPVNTVTPRVALSRQVQPAVVRLARACEACVLCL